jgi:hypothetical protein
MVIKTLPGDDLVQWERSNTTPDEIEYSQLKNQAVRKAREEQLPSPDEPRSNDNGHSLIPKAPLHLQWRFILQR